MSSGSRLDTGPGPLDRSMCFLVAWDDFLSLPLSLTLSSPPSSLILLSLPISLPLSYLLFPCTFFPCTCLLSSCLSYDDSLFIQDYNCCV